MSNPTVDRYTLYIEVDELNNNKNTTNFNLLNHQSKMENQMKSKSEEENKVDKGEKKEE